MASRNGRSLEKVRTAQRKAQTRLAGVREVNGIGITRVGSGFGLKVNLSSPTSRERVPEQIEGVPVQVEVVGTIRPRRSA